MPGEQPLVRPNWSELGAGRLSRMEAAQLRAIQSSFSPGGLDRTLRWLQQTAGCWWITEVTKHLRRVHGRERLPPLRPEQSFILAANHRSFFDLYVVTAHLVREGLPHRIVFPVRSEFFYDSAAGFVVNGLMSFFAMYPPVFRDRARASLNLAGLDEMTWLLRQGGVFLGIHPEGTRKKDDDPYTFLPAQSGVGRLIHHSDATVLPVFVNGLLNDLPRQVRSNYDGTGQPVNIVFGEPLDMSDLRARPRSPRVYKLAAERTVEAIGRLGQEERELRGR